MKRIIWSVGIVLGVLISSGAAQEAAGWTDEEVVTFGNKVAEVLNNKDETGLVSLMDTDTFIDRLLNGFDTTASPFKEFKSSPFLVLNQLVQGTTNTIPEGSTISFLRRMNFKQGDSVILRMDFGEEGLGYWALLLNKKEDGDIKYIDWYDLARADYATNSVRKIWGVLFPQEDGSLLSGLFGASENFSAEDVRLVTALVNARNTQDWGMWIRNYSRLRSDLRALKEFMVLHIEMSYLSNDPETVKSAGEALYESYGDDPDLALSFVDHFYFTQNYEGALESIDHLEKLVGGDGALDMMRAGIALMEPNYEKALEYCERGLAREKHYGPLYETLVVLLSDTERESEIEQIAADYEKHIGKPMDVERVLAEAETPDPLIESLVEERFGNE